MAMKMTVVTSVKEREKFGCPVAVDGQGSNTED